jgi:hypothetical protein
VSNRDKLRRLVLATVALVPLSCGPALATAPKAAAAGAGTAGGAGGAGTVNGGKVALLLTDDPWPYGNLVLAALRITKMELVSGGAPTTLKAFSAMTPGFYDTLPLRNGATSTIATEIIPPGSYDTLRMTFAGARIRLKTATTFDSGPAVLEMPLSPPLTLAVGDSTQVLFDIDMARSITFVGAGVSFNPAGRAAVVGSGGAIGGKVLDASGNPVADATVTVTGPVTATTATDPDGSWSIMELPIGSYQVVAEAVGLGSASTNASPMQGGIANVSLQLSTSAPPPPPALPPGSLGP